MTKRILSTFGLWATIVAVLYFFGSAGGILLLALLAAATQYELYQLLEKMGDYRPLKAFGIALGVVIIAGSFAMPEAGALEVFTITLIALSVTMLRWPEVKRIYLPTLFGLVYVAFMLQFYGLLISQYGSVMVPIFLIAAAKFSDVGGLLFGMKFGKHKLCPSISPGKTVEGGIGAVFTSALVGGLLWWGFGDYLPAGLSLPVAILIAAITGALALVSDLIESILKRQAGVKDSGTAIPGIGGAFDLMDSLILTAPVGYLLFKYFV